MRQTSMRLYEVERSAELCLIRHSDLDYKVSIQQESKFNLKSFNFLLLLFFFLTEVSIS